MSHFVIIVTGTKTEKDLEKALAPFDENKRVPEYKDSDGDLTTYNPKSKWDWYQVGGRWSGYFLLKNGQRVDTCRWGDVDTEALGKEAETRARADFERWERALKAQEGARPEAWMTVLERALKDQPPETHRELVDKAREEYGAQPAIAAYRTLTDAELAAERQAAHDLIDAAYWRFCRMARAKPPILEVPEAYQRRVAADVEIARRRKLINTSSQEPPA